MDLQVASDERRREGARLDKINRAMVVHGTVVVRLDIAARCVQYFMLIIGQPQPINMQNASSI